MAASITAGERPRFGRLTRPLPLGRVRTDYNELSLATLISRIERAENGDTRDWALTTRRMLKTDDHLVSVKNTRIDAVANAPYEITPPRNVRAADVELAQLAARVCQGALDHMDDLAIVQRDLLDAIGMGWSAGELVWEQRGVAILPEAIVPIHPARFSFTEEIELALREDLLTRTLEGERVYTRGGTAIRLPKWKYLVHQSRQNFDFAPSTGLYLTSARPWWVKQWVMKYWLSGAEVGGNPRVKGKFTKQVAKEVRERLFETLESMAADGIFVAEDGTDIEMIAGLAADSAELWDKLYTRMDAAHSKAWLGSTLNVEIGDTGGARAAAESQGSLTMLPRSRQDAKAWWADVRRCVFRAICELNVGRLWSRMPPVPVGRSILDDETEDSVAQPSMGDIGTVLANVTSGSLRSDAAIEMIALALPRLSRAKVESLVRAAAPINGVIDTPAPAPKQETPDDSPPEAPTAKAPTGAPEGLDVAAGASVQTSALNGAQVTSLLDIVGRVVDGQLPRDSAIEIIVSAFPIDRAQAEKILGSVGVGFTPSAEPEAPKPFANKAALSDGHADGVMVCVEIPADLAAHLALADGEAPEDLHVTLAYLGRAFDLDVDIGVIATALEQYAAKAAPLTGIVGGLGRFSASETSDGLDVVYASVDVPGLGALRAALVVALEAAGAEVNAKHDFTAHITLAYVPTDSDLPIQAIDPKPLAVSALALVVGDVRQRFALGGGS